MSSEVHRHAPIPVTLIGGFLGAGKTSLLNHVLSENHGVRAAVLVNDFGAVNIDAKLVVGVEGEAVSLANGCVCCSIREDLAEACLGLLRRPEAPEHVLIELSGVADPVPVVDTFLETELRALFSLSSTLAVVDAEMFPRLQGEMADLARLQVTGADIVAINKVDLVGQADLVDVRDRVHEMAPGSRILEVRHGRVPLELIFGAASRPSGTPREGDLRDRDGHTQANAFSTWHWGSDRPLSLPALRSVLTALPDGVYRAKGILCLEELPSNRYVLQMVGRRYSIQETGRWGGEPPRSEIVLIGSREGIDGDELRRRFDPCVGTGDEAGSPLLRLARKLAAGNDAATGESD